MPYYEELTVRENLTLAAQMRLSSNFGMEKKFKRVEQVMYEVGYLIRNAINSLIFTLQFVLSY